MEINAKVYAAARDEELLKKAAEQLKEMTFHNWYGIDLLEPCAVLPLTETWYGFTLQAEPAYGPEAWTPCLRECGRILKKDGAVIVEFRSPDDPDTYLEYAYTTPNGNSGYGRNLLIISTYVRSLGCKDIQLALDELFSERTARDRMFASRRKEKKEAVRKEKGDFEISEDGVLKRYRGISTHVVIPDGVKEIEDSAFVDLKGVERMLMEDEEYDAPPMQTLEIPDSVEKIGSYALAYCMNLEEIEIPDSVRFIGDRAFEGCESLKKVRLSNALAEIGEYSFFLCSELKSITIPEGVRRIGKGAFDSCFELGKVTFPQSLASIGEEAFHGTRVRKACVPAGVAEIGRGAFPERD